MLTYTGDDIAQMNTGYRRNLLNCLSGFKSLNLLGTVSNKGQENVALFNSVVHIGANPPYLGFILRPTSVPRDTYENIMAVGEYTINHVSLEIFEQAHQTSAKYGRDISEFAETGLSPVYFNCKAPYVGEAPVKIGLNFIESHVIHANMTRLIVGEVNELILPDDALDETGFLDLAKAGVLAGAGLEGYYEGRLVKRLPYARPK